MKTYIRTLTLINEYEQQKMRRYLNNLGFYAVSAPANGVEVYAIKEEKSLLDRVGYFLAKLIGGKV